MCFVVGANFAGRKKLLLRAQNLDCESEEQLIVDQMDLKKEFPELNKNLYPSIEPYSTGFLKVSDLHTIYWEQSGNPNGHVSFFPPIFSFHSLVMLALEQNLFMLLEQIKLIFMPVSRRKIKRESNYLKI